MAVSYGTETTIAAWTRPSYAPSKVWDVIPYVGGAAVTGDQQLNVATEDDADNYFKQMTESGRYDQVKKTEKLIDVPS